MMRKLMNKYEMPQFNISEIKGNNIFVLGIGGGSDVVGAYGFGSIVKKSNPKAIVNFGLCVSKKENYSGFKKINNSLYLRDNSQKSINNSHTSLELIQKMAEYDNDLPSPFLLVRLPKFEKVSEKYGLGDFYHTLLSEFADAINYISPDLIIAIDMGGDSLTCGVEDENSFDRSGLRTLKRIGKPFIYIVFGVGCDGESTAEMIANSIEKEYEAKSLLGEFSLKEIIGLTKAMSKSILKDDRTPNIIADAVSVFANSEDKLITIPRHRKPQIPLSWITKGITFDGLKLSIE